MLIYRNHKCFYSEEVFSKKRTQQTPRVHAEMLILRNLYFRPKEKTVTNMQRMPELHHVSNNLMFLAKTALPSSGRDVTSRFGRRLRELRRERNLTQLRMAIDFGIDRSFISDVERGRKSMSLPMLEVVALGLHVSLSDLLRDI